MKIKRFNELYEASQPQKELEGKRIRLIRMELERSPIEPGSEGTINHVDLAGVIHVIWDNGQTISIIPDLDEYEIIN